MKFIVRREHLHGFGVTLLGVSFYFGSRKLNFNYHRPFRHNVKEFHWMIGK